MKQRKGMQQFECCTSINDPRVGSRTSGTDKTPKREDGPQTLTTTHHHARKFGKWRGKIGVKLHPTSLFVSQ
jgi:hypothetical protein